MRQQKWYSKGSKLSIQAKDWGLTIEIKTKSYWFLQLRVSIESITRGESSLRNSKYSLDHHIAILVGAESSLGLPSWCCWLRGQTHGHRDRRWNLLFSPKRERKFNWHALMFKLWKLFFRIVKKSYNIKIYNIFS